jgi:hypothetical protein
MSLTIPSSTLYTPSRTPSSRPVETLRPSKETPPPPRLDTELQTVNDNYEQALVSQKEWLQKYGGSPEQIASLDEAIQNNREAVVGLNNDRNSQDNVVTNDQKQTGRWSDDAPVLQQEGDSDCGETVATMLKGSKEGREGVQGERGKDVAHDFKNRFSSEEGTRPTELGDMLASEGIQVKQSSTHLDTDALEGSLRNGDKAVVMLDSKISGDPAQVAGSAHWVLVDGMDSQGRYLVKDPSNGSSNYVRPEELADAIDTNQGARQSGGVLLVGNSDASVQELTDHNRGQSGVLGNDPGQGSKWRGNVRESSEG